MPGSHVIRPTLELSAGRRVALVISNTTYVDPGLRRLRAPASDAAEMAEVLGDENIGGFAVSQVPDKAEPQVRRTLAEFLTGRSRDDLVLVYISCHGVLDPRGRLYFAVADTFKRQLAATGVESAWLLERLDECQARSQILILDCCFSGSFAKGSKGEVDLAVRLKGHGRGRTVLTASRAGEYSFEGRPLPGSTGAGSVFTAGLIEGLRTGAADANGDGYISLDEAYDYAYYYVQKHREDQTPQRWLYGAEGDVILARHPKGIAAIRTAQTKAATATHASQGRRSHVGDNLGSIEDLGAVGEISFVVRYDPYQHTYRFEFRGDGPGEVTSQLPTQDFEPYVDQLMTDIRDLTTGRLGFSATEAREYLVNAGASLWRELIPVEVREQFWEYRDRIKHLTIFSGRDPFPWELLYPLDPGRHGTGFLMEQVPLTRRVEGFPATRRLRLSPAWFVLPSKSPSGAGAEVDAIRHVLDDPEQPTAVISALTPLLELIQRGKFGVLHFVCHNKYEAKRGSRIMLDGRPFTSTFMTTAINARTLENAGPLVFVNAAKTDEWAHLFMEAGAGAAIGTLADVRDDTAREFAVELYRHLQAGATLGLAVLQARQTAANSQADDPSWLTYTVYGDPDAKVYRQSPGSVDTSS